MPDLESITQLDLDGLVRAMPEVLGEEPRRGLLVVLGLDDRGRLVASATLHLWHMLDVHGDLAANVVDPLRGQGATAAICVGYDDHHARRSGAEGLRRLHRMLTGAGLPVTDVLQVGLATGEWREAGA